MREAEERKTEKKERIIGGRRLIRRREDMERRTEKIEATKETRRTEWKQVKRSGRSTGS